jgi:Ran GTPase-activating protein (RanGAP) involved in mRNA processing and transport
MVIAEALKVNSCLTYLGFGSNFIHDKGAQAIADALKVNSSLAYLCISANAIQDKGATAMADALLENTGLTSHHFESNEITRKGAASIARALTYNPSLVELRVYNNIPYELSGLQEFKSTSPCLQDLLNNLIGRDGAQILGITFQIKSRCIIDESDETIPTV